MAGRPKTRARIAAEVAAMGGTPLPPALPYKKRVVPKAAPRAKVVSSLPPIERPVVVDTVDSNFGAALASVASGTPGSPLNVIFEELRVETMRFALEVMRMELDPDEKSFNKLLGVKQQIATAVLTATTRVRPGDLRERDDDGLGALLEKLKSPDELTADEPTAADLLN